MPDYQLSLAIGKEGQNARLAARLTGWRVDIKSETQLAEEEAYDDRRTGPRASGSSTPRPASRCGSRPRAARPCRSRPWTPRRAPSEEAEGEALAEAVADGDRGRGHRRARVVEEADRGGRSRRPSDADEPSRSCVEEAVAEETDRARLSPRPIVERGRSPTAPVAGSRRSEAAAVADDSADGRRSGVSRTAPFVRDRPVARGLEAAFPACGTRATNTSGCRRAASPPDVRED